MTSTLALLVPALAALAPTQLGEPLPLTEILVPARVEDLDADGQPELLVISRTEFELRALQPEGLDRLVPVRTLIRAEEPFSGLAFGDLDGDGDRDAVTFFEESQTIRVFPRVGAGQLGTPQVVGNLPGELAQAELVDLDGDGDLDVLLGTFSTTQGVAGQVVSIENLGSMTFGPATTLIFDTGDVTGFIAEDMDSDGDVDVACIRDSGRLITRVNDGNGSFGVSLIGAGLSSIRGLAALDATGDGQLDFVVSADEGSSADLHVLEIEAEGDAASWRPLATGLVTESGVHGVRARDLDGDGDEDLILLGSYRFSNISGPGAAIVENRGGGVFGPVTPLYASPITSTIGRLLWADLDSDGAMELIVGSTGDGGQGLVLRADAAAPGLPVSLGDAVLVASPSTKPREISLTDLTGNGVDEIALDFGFGVPSRALDLGVDTGVLEPLGTTGDPVNLAWRHVADFDLDGDLETLGVVTAPPSLVLIEGGSTAAATTIATGTERGAPLVVDIDGDGDLDVIWQALIREWTLVRNDGAAGWTTLTFGLGAAKFHGEAAVSDVDQDGLLDLVFTSREDPVFGIDALFMARGTASGLPGPALPIDTAGTFDALFTSNAGLEIFDVNSDGLDDLVLCVPAATADQLFWIPGTGGGSFGSLSVLLPAADIGELLRDIELIDVVGSDERDLVLLTETQLQVWTRAAAGSWAQASTREVGIGSRLAQLDLDRDDDQDVVFVAAGYPKGGLLAFRNLRRDSVGEAYCGPSLPNSTGETGKLAAIGRSEAAANDIELRVSDVPPSTFGFFLNSLTPGNVTGMTGAASRLCLSGDIGRYVGPGEIRQSNAFGQFALTLDLASTPQPSGAVSAVAGETWHFQGWHRDTTGTAATSGFTEAVRVTLQ